MSEYLTWSQSAARGPETAPPGGEGVLYLEPNPEPEGARLAIVGPAQWFSAKLDDSKLASTLIAYIGSNLPSAMDEPFIRSWNAEGTGKMHRTDTHGLLVATLSRGGGYEEDGGYDDYDTGDDAGGSSDDDLTIGWTLADDRFVVVASNGGRDSTVTQMLGIEWPERDAMESVSVYYGE